MIFVIIIVKKILNKYYLKMYIDNDNEHERKW